VYENDSIVAIATMHSRNGKTGNMVQLYILTKNEHPVEACHSGADSLICGDCKHRPANMGTCYVTLPHGPVGVWKAYHRGRYPFLESADYARVFAGRALRLGAYGDPVFLPFSILEKMTAAASGHTGYTHQWRRCSAKYRNLVMASVDNDAEYRQAKAKGWRTFRVKARDAENLPGEITCPAILGKTHCLRCLLCSGMKRANAKDIAVPVHGSRASSFDA